MADTPPFPGFQLSLTGTECSVRAGLAQTMKQLAPLSLSAQDQSTVELVLAEALNNVVEHALAGAAPDTRIDITACHSATRLRICITDRGSPMPKGKAPATCAPDLDVACADLPEGGFGWYMIHALSHEVRYDRIDNTNQLMLVLAVG